MWYPPDYQNQKFNLCMLNSFKGFHLCIKPLCGTLIINLGKKWICVYYCKQIKTSLQEPNKNTKYVLQNKYEQLHISAKTTEIKLLKF